MKEVRGEFQEEERFETESDVVLTSLESLPKSISSADAEYSSYEEVATEGNRENQLGQGRVYRVMMKSFNPAEAKSRMEKLIQKYGASQVDAVKPGKEVPGGSYYNLFVPTNYLREFMYQIMSMNEAILYETRVKAHIPLGKNRVFIWIKSL